MTDTSGHPIVTVVIPTLNRSQLLVQRALRSALSQTLANIEVVVVVDGPDPATIEALEEMDDPRLRWIALPENAGGSEARKSASAPRRATGSRCWTTTTSGCLTSSNGNSTRRFTPPTRNPSS
jgi:GT2 family glycosyltransferase